MTSPPHGTGVSDPENSAVRPSSAARTPPQPSSAEAEKDEDEVEITPAEKRDAEMGVTEEEARSSQGCSSSCSFPSFIAFPLSAFA